MCGRCNSNYPGTSSPSAGNNTVQGSVTWSSCFINSSFLLFIENHMSHCQREAIYFKSVGGLSYKMAAELIFLYSYIGDLFLMIAIGAAVRANGVRLINRSYDNRPTC